MKVLYKERNILSIQKCLLPDCGFLRQNFGRYCIVSQNNYKVIVKIGLCEVKQIDKSLFLDPSVLIFPSPEETLRTDGLRDITFDNFTVLGKPKTSKIVKVVVVFTDFLDVIKYKNSQNLRGVVRDILKLFVISNHSLVLLTNLPETQKFGISCIVVENGGSNSNDIFQVDSDTDVVIQKCISQVTFAKSKEKENRIHLGGCNRVWTILKETLDFSKCWTNKNVKFVNKLLLIGPAGCGKTTLVHNVASDCKYILLEISPCNINTLPPEKMEQKLESIFVEAKIYAENKECCLILIEDIDMMSSGRTLHAKRFVRKLIKLLEMVDNMHGIVVVGTTNNPDEVDLQLRRPKRLEDEIEMLIPTEEERAEILEKILSHYKVQFNRELLQQVAHWTPGFVGADLRLLAAEALMMFKNKNSLQTAKQVQLECFKAALKKVIPSSLRGTVGLCMSNNMTFSQLGGLEEIKKTLDLLVKQQLENPKKFEKFRIPLTKGILLYGPPGCAKTTLVKALATECNTTFLATSAADLYSPFVGDAEKKIVQLFSQARIGSPSILFIDEIDVVVGSKSGDRERGVQERILSTLLIEMDGIGIKVHTNKDNSLNLFGDGEEETRKEMNSSVIVIGATNRPQMLDDALKRPGRFDRLLYIPPPDESERFRILKKLTENMPLHESVDINRLAKLTNFYSGADLKNLVQEAGLHALKSTEMAAECVSLNDFESILTKYKPSLNENIINFYESFQECNT